MSFTGKATYSAGNTLPELAEDVADIVGIVSPFETPLLDHLGDPQRAAHSTLHEWLEDSLFPNADTIDDDSITNPATETAFTVAHGDRFRPGDQLQVVGSREVMLVTAVVGDELTVARGYGGTAAAAISTGATITILGNAALEGAEPTAARFTNRARKSNVTQIFSAKVEVSGSQLASRQLALDDELDYQKQERLRELVRDLENCVINGIAHQTTPLGGASVRRTMRGILPSLTTNLFTPGDDGLPPGDEIDAVPGYLSEELLNAALRRVWEQSAGTIDTILVGGFQKRRINSFLSASRGYTPQSTRYRDLVATYESDFGVCRVVLSRWCPSDALLLLDSSRIDVLPLAGRSFHFKELASTGDSEAGLVVGEYTLELRNENAHGVIRGLTTG